MKKFKHEVAETMQVLGATLKIKWAIAVIAVFVIAAVGLCGGNYHAVAHFVMSYYALIFIESIAVGIWTLCHITTDKHQ